MVNCNDTIRISGIHGNDRATTNGKQGFKFATWRAAITGVVVSAVEYLALRQARARDRYNVQRLDDHMLKDVGMTRADIEQEFSKPVLWGFPRRG